MLRITAFHLVKEKQHGKTWENCITWITWICMCRFRKEPSMARESASTAFISSSSLGMTGSSMYLYDTGLAQHEARARPMAAGKVSARLFSSLIVIVYHCHMSNYKGCVWLYICKEDRVAPRHHRVILCSLLNSWIVFLNQNLLAQLLWALNWHHCQWHLAKGPSFRLWTSSHVAASVISPARSTLNSDMLWPCSCCCQLIVGTSNMPASRLEQLETCRTHAAQALMWNIRICQNLNWCFGNS